MSIRVIVDCSIYWYQCWHRMKSPGVTLKSDIEVENYAPNLFKDLYELKQRFNPVDMVLGLDSKEWRSPYFLKYFQDRIHFWKNRRESHYWVMKVGVKYFRSNWNTSSSTWGKPKKLTQKEEAVLDLTDPETWIFFEKGMTPKYILDAYPDTFKSVYESPDWDGLVNSFPAYKGGRNLEWPYSTPYQEFKRISRNATKHIAATIGARVVEAPNAEFDDICHAYCAETTPHHTVICTADQDMDQEVLHGGAFVHIWRPTSRIWSNLTAEQAKIHLLCKLVGGDSSDKIPSIIIREIKEKGPKNNKTQYETTRSFPTVKWSPDGLSVTGGDKTYTFVTELLEECGGDLGAFNAHLKDIQYDSTYTRNVSMMHLGAAPASVQEACRLALDNSTVQPVKYTPSNWLVTDNEIRVCQHNAISQFEAEKAERGFIDDPT